MTLPKELQILLEKNHGMMNNRQAKQLGISRERLRLIVLAGELERMANGVYLVPDSLPDNLYMWQLRRSKLIYSHETALYMHELTDRDPTSYSVTVPRGYNALSLCESGLRVYTVALARHELGAVQMQTAFGHPVRVYGLERTICDCVRSRNQMDVAVVTEALKRYARRSDRNLNELMRMAEVFRIVHPLKRYLEVLL